MKPPALSVAINHTRHTLKGIQQEKAFSINVPSTELVKEVDFCGIYSGKKKDKSGMFEVFHGDLQAAPLIREWCLWYDSDTDEIEASAYRWLKRS